MKKILLGVFVCLSVFVLFVQCSYSQEEQAVLNCNKDEVPKLVISRTGNVEAEPDKAIINIRIVTEEAKVGRASDKNKERINSVMNILKEYQIENKDIKTVEYSVTPLYEGKAFFSSVQRPTSYRVTNAIAVNFLKLDDIGKILNKISEIDYANVYNITFTSTKMEELKRGALKKAAESARITAMELADVAGGKLGKVLRIEEYSPVLRQGAFQEASLMKYKAESVMADTVVEAGTLEVEAACTITYQVDPK